MMTCKCTRSTTNKMPRLGQTTHACRKYWRTEDTPLRGSQRKLSLIIIFAKYTTKNSKPPSFRTRADTLALFWRPLRRKSPKIQKAPWRTDAHGSETQDVHHHCGHWRIRNQVNKASKQHTISRKNQQHDQTYNHQVFTCALVLGIFPGNLATQIR